jgi:Family of unknown function (DUF6502)
VNTLPPTGAEHALQADAQALTDALSALVVPMARLAVARGLRFAAVEELLKQAFVAAATQALREAHPNVASHRMVSRISTTTGIHRREVTRLSQQTEETSSHARPSLATEVFTRWITDGSLRTADGQMASLKRQGPAPSFESLAQSITRDVHPRSLLDELCRLGLAAWDETSDEVSLQSQAFVPKGDMARMLAFLGDNVGDHLQAAVSNVLSGEAAPTHFEQAVFSDELSAQALPVIKAMVQAHWQQLLAESVPLLEKLIEQDRQAGRPQDQRVRIGLFSYSETVAPNQPDDG